ncbi:related to UTP6-U3 snoRNP protein [Phialocephala subalpina]|uniref:Related to UTP6-U3 snoRNP protein n=1 Tax=Phialocephala subalpina TaxID=576137 RepID=A0A1L7XGT3_9HELO|nr:related to UTP6-U3 snoRNP protein [Phialocephala subalpina]
MSGASDKARFYLEQAVPQLQEFKEKKIFNEDEIRTLVKKRSDFEHKVLARGSQPVDFARYAAWEIGLETLRQKRCKRLRIKGSTTHSGQARIFNIFDRGTKKHPGDVALWMSYLEYARTAKANKKFKTILTAAIRLHPTKSELWLYAARWTLEAEADMNGARSYMQRGTRFCTTSKDLWIEYAKLEMIYLAKITMRRKILGLDVEDTQEDTMEIDEGVNDAGFTTSEDMIAIPDFKTNSIRLSMVERVEVDSEASKDPMTTPALNGAIPLAIFDAARTQPFFCASTAEAFFDMFAMFSQVRCLSTILQHVLDVMVELYPIDPFTCSCYIRQPVMGISPLSAEFVVALGTSLARLKESMGKIKDKAELAKRTRAWTKPILELEDLDPGIRAVLEHMRKLQ